MDRARGQLRGAARARGARVEAYGIARVRGRAAPSLRRVSPRRSPRRAAPPRRTAPVATVALLHVPLVGMALLHAQGPRSAQ